MRLFTAAARAHLSNTLLLTRREERAGLGEEVGGGGEEKRFLKDAGEEIK